MGLVAERAARASEAFAAPTLRAAVGQRVVRVRAVPRLQPRDPPGDLQHEHHRESPGPDAPGDPERGGTSPTSRPRSSASTLSCVRSTRPAEVPSAGRSSPRPA